MRAFFCAAVVAMLVPCAARAQAEVIPFEEVRGKTHVTVRIGGVEIPDILLDTGFAFDGLMVYNPDYQDSLDLAGAVEVQIGGAGSGDASKAMMIDGGEFVLGGVRMTGQRIIMLRGDHYRGFPSNGIIGYSIFGHYAAELDFDRKVIVLHDPAGPGPGEGWAAVPIYFKENNIPWVDAAVVIEDEPPVTLSMYIDYAMGTPVLLLEKPGMKFSVPDGTTEEFLGRGLSGDIYGRTGRIAKLIIGPYELRDVTASFADEKVRSKQPGADAILGVRSLRRFNLIFDYAGKKLYIRPNGNFGGE
ncbi:MAG TPA: hypothetical protein VLA34_00480 [Candidatus Krumholzibacterium sp.]|nr:hypothetical protein [Candidatus Krumholzibacterium sp.]